MSSCNFNKHTDPNKSVQGGFFLEKIAVHVRQFGTLEYVLSNSSGSPGIHQSKTNSRIFSKKALKMSFKNRVFSKSNECLKNEIVAAADLNNEVLASELIF